MPFVPLAEAAEPKGGFTPVGPERSKVEAFDDAAREGVDRVGRQVGLTARAAVQGFPLVALPNMVGDALGLRSSDALRSALTKMGLPEPANATERVAGDVASGMSGAAGVVKGGVEIAKTAVNPIVQRIGEVLAANPTSQIIAGATGPGAASVTREAGGGPIAQTAAGTAGTFVPALPAAAAATVRGLVRGGEAGRQRMLQNIDTFEESGAGTPTVGQATEGRGARTVESVLARTPGGAGPMVAKAESEAANLGSKVDDMAASLAPQTGAEPAGRAIKAGVEQHVQDFKEASGKLYDKVDSLIDPKSMVSVDNARKYLNDATAVNPNAKATSGLLVNPKLKAIRDALEADLGGNSTVMIGGNRVPVNSPLAKAAGVQQPTSELPYGMLKKLRTDVGEMMADPKLTSDVPQAQLKRLYGALTKDMAAAARGVGPEAEAALVKANNFHREGMTHIEDVLQPIVSKADPEKMFIAAVSGTKEGATTISGVMKSLPEESRKVVAATMLQRLGKALPGKQDDLGEVFSTETFLTNWNKLHPDAKRSLFAPLPAQMRSDLDQIAKVASNVREGSKVFANPSGTAQANLTHEMGWGTAGAAVMQLAYGHPLGAAATVGAAAGGVISANLMAKAMTSPTVVHWLAETTKVPVGQLPAQLNDLFRQSLYMKGDERRDARALIKEIRTGLQPVAQETQQSKEVPQ
jgi:hypothetical protein